MKLNNHYKDKHLSVNKKINKFLDGYLFIYLFLTLSILLLCFISKENYLFFFNLWFFITVIFGICISFFLCFLLMEINKYEKTMKQIKIIQHQLKDLNGGEY